MLQFNIPFSRKVFIFQSNYPVNELIVVIEYVNVIVLLLNSGSNFSKMPASLKSTTAILV